MSARKNIITFHLDSGKMIDVDGSYADYKELDRGWKRVEDDSTANLSYISPQGAAITLSLAKLEAVSFR